MHTQGRSCEHFPVDRFFFNFCGSQIIYLSEMRKILGVTEFVSEIKRVENYPDFGNLALVILNGLQGFIIKNIEGESKEANDPSHIL